MCRMPGPPTPISLRRAGMVGALVTAVVGFGVGALVLAMLPPWLIGRTGMLILVSCIVIGAAVGGLLPWTRHLVGRGDGAQRQPRRWLIALSAAVLVAGAVVCGVLGQAVVASYTMPSHPARVEAISSYRPCHSRGCRGHVVFDAGGTRVDARYAGGLFARDPTGAGVPFVYDPADPTHVMPERDFAFGRGWGAVWFVLTAAAVLAWFAGVWANVRRRR